MTTPDTLPECQAYCERLKFDLAALRQRAKTGAEDA